MSTSKNYNRMVFLTTLSVYLGLVLVGATPPALAHAALTQRIEIQNEIETDDDLDKNPEDCESLKTKADEKLNKFGFSNQAISDYAKVLTNLIKINKQLYSNDFALKFDTNFYSNETNKPYFSLASRPVLYPKNARQQLNKDLEILSALFPKIPAQNENSFVFDFDLDNKMFKSSTKFLQQNDFEARKVFIAYDSSLDFWRCKSKNTPESIILQNTEISYENNQVFIVTRLPRASIDALLAEKVAK